MGYRMDLKDVNRMSIKPQEEYEIWAPERSMGKGRYSDADLTKYVRVDWAKEVEYRERSDFPAKEVLSPIIQPLFYFTEDEFIESKVGSKKLPTLMWSCDTHAQHHQEKIYLTNSGYKDIYYKRMNEKVEIVMMECGEGWDTCFCVDMGTSKTDNYSMVVRLGEDGLEFQVKGHAFVSYSEGMRECPFESQSMKKNELTLTVPEIPDKEVLTKPREHPMWKQFDGWCTSCDACTVACSAYTCFTITGIIYNENRNVGECKRTSASCQIKNFTDIADGMSFRNGVGDRMRYKVLHKFHDYKARFKDYHMCVGCGRCMDRCPEYTSVVVIVNKMTDVIEEIKTGKQA